MSVPKVNNPFAQNYLTAANNACDAVRAALVIVTGSVVGDTVIEPVPLSDVDAASALIQQVELARTAAFQLAAALAIALPALDFYASPGTYLPAQTLVVDQDKGATAKYALDRINPT